MNKNKVIIALDNDNLNINLELIKELKNEAFAFKVGSEFFLISALLAMKELRKKILKFF